MQPNIKISVVIPLYNKRDYILRSVNSVLAQSYDNLELIVVDDGSTDGSANSIRSVVDSRLSIHRQNNAGEGAARNTGAKLATSNWVAYLDADDSWKPEFLAEIATMVNKFPSATLCATGYRIRTPGSCTVVGTKGQAAAELHSNFFKLAHAGKLPFCASSVAVSREVLIACGGFAEQEPLGADQDLWCRLLTNTSFAFNPQALATYHEDAQGRVCNRQTPTSELAFSKRLQKKLDSGFMPFALIQDAKRYIAAHLLHLATMNARQGDVGTALEMLGDPRTKHLPWKRSMKLVEFNLRNQLYNNRS